jgi:membrane protein
MLLALRIPIGWKDLAKRTFGEVVADNCLGLAAQLAYYFFLALFPALLFLVALIGFIPIANLLDTITAALARVAPGEALAIVQDQVLKF